MDIAIIDYGVGNLRSAEKAFQHLGFDAALTREPAALQAARKIVLPGVGAFGECMERLREHGFVEPLLAEVRVGKPVLGICVGMQMLFEGSEESTGVKGLGLLKGGVRKFIKSEKEKADGDVLKIPQIGWNGLSFPEGARHALFEGVAPGTHVYFVHSYYAEPEASDAIAWSDYGGRFCASAARRNIMGVQFHPEKSQRVGLGILGNFVRRC